MLRKERKDSDERIPNQLEIREKRDKKRERERGKRRRIS